jgi:hypothetical protein
MDMEVVMRGISLEQPIFIALYCAHVRARAIFVRVLNPRDAIQLYAVILTR